MVDSVQSVLCSGKMIIIVEFQSILLSIEWLRVLQHKLRSSRTMILIIIVFLDMRCLIDDLPGSFEQETNFT